MVGTRGETRRCDACSALLGSDNTAALCGKCLRDRRDQLKSPPAGLPDAFWMTADFAAAFESQHIGKVIKVYRNHQRHLRTYGKALNQELMGRWLGITQAQVSKMENGKAEHNLQVLRAYAKILHIPQRFLWFDFPGQSRRTETNSEIVVDRLTTNGNVAPRIAWPDTAQTMASLALDFDEASASRRAATVRMIVEGIRRTTADLMSMDFRRGGGSVRRLLTHFFQSEVAPLMSWNYPDHELRRDAFGAIAETLQVLAWSAYDAGSHEEARNHFISALRLAREGDDFLMVGNILSNLSHQENFLGNFDKALKFAQQAQEVTRGRGAGKVQSMFISMEARALASLGDKYGMTQALHRAEQQFDLHSGSDEPEWIWYFDSHELAGEAAHCFQSVGDSANACKFAEIALNPTHTPERTLGFLRMVAASGTLAGGDAERAAALAGDAITLGLSLQSARYVKYLSEFYRTIADKDRVMGQQLADLLYAYYPNLIEPI